MRAINIKWLVALMCLMLCFTLMMACGGDDTPADTTANTADGEVTVTETEINTNTDTEIGAVDTSASEETQSEAGTQAQATDTSDAVDTGATTEAITEADTHEPAPLTEVSFDAVAQVLEGKSLTQDDFIVRVNKAKATISDDPDEGKVLALTTDGITTNTANPFVQLKYSALADIMGELNVNTQETPYMVLRVKDASLWSHTFTLRAYKSSNPSVNDGGLVGEQKVHLSGDGWQYIAFDLSAATEELLTYRLSFENAANANGETLLISHIKFVATKEAAEALAGNNTYEIQEQTADDYTLKVMTFNVQTENGTSVRMDIRADMLRDLIDEYQPDSIGMQEVTPSWRAYMDSYVFNDSYTGVGEARTTNASLGLEQSCIFYRSDKFDLLDSGTFWLSDTPDVVGSVYEGSQYPRICTYVHLKDKATGLEYIHMNTHLDNAGGSDGRALRLAQETVMLQKLATLADVPTVITGDFNQLAHNSEGSAYAVYKLMTGERAFEMPDGTKITMNLADSRVHAPENMPEGFTATMTVYHDETNERYNPSREPIDYVFYTPDHLEALSYAIRLYDRDGVYLSDHLPVITTFKIIKDTANNEADAS